MKEKKSLIDTLLNDTPPDDYLKQEAHQLKEIDVGVQSEKEELKKPFLPPEMMTVAIVTGLVGGMMLVVYSLIFLVF
ncbi:hypothetical protein [Domibacillus mangrovi]|uniref:Uncharacterized protein n=1 Tax=Domibacillus mangrovi TaxID=1714354 RepID=A0A1Q5P653_9BACI|nr:hypothetical protein [Domibacillus mangrovi]OKL37707.1 hypothetical protein BLL40_03290 [Domibacillus mangrovi]